MTDAAAPPLHITLLRHGDLIVVDLAERGTLIPRSEIHVDDAFLRDLTTEIEAVVVRRGPDTTQALARIGGLIFSHLLSEPARRRLCDAPPSDLYLRLDERLVHVPWELCHDGTAFLFERFRVGRQVITGQAIPETRVPRADHDRLRVLVIADPTEDLPQAALEGERLCSLLDDVDGVEVTLLAGRSVRRIALLAALQEHDVVHFAGHSAFDAAAPTRSGWRLADGVLTAGELAKLRPAPFLVFSNSCEAATSAAWESGQGYDGHAFGIGSAFLLAGVPSYVGTFWVVHDTESVTFATACYQALANGGRLGDALAAARRAVVEQCGAGALTWASYLLYGDPALRPLATASEPPRTRKSSSSVREEVRFAVSIANGSDSAPAVDRVEDGRHLVGREADLERLTQAFTAIRSGERGVVFVSGPPGIGKTTLIDAFVARIRLSGEAFVATGQSVEQYGAGEAYLPLLEALGRLAAEDQQRVVVDRLRRHAPTWLAQLPALIEPAEHEALARRTQGSTRDRMLRELADVLEAVTADRTLVLVLEDLHWADRSTIEAVAYVAQRRAPARLLVVGTYRPAEIAAGEHPLRAVTLDLRARRRSSELGLDVLGEIDVEAYLKARLGADTIDAGLAGTVHRRTDGHPLFLVNVVDFALREGLITVASGRIEARGGESALASSTPLGLLPMIERQIEVLPAEEQQVLEAAAVAGAEMSAASVAAALEANVDEIDERCQGLAWRGQFLRAAGVEEWPDGTLAGRYRFVHALYQNVLYERVAEPRRVRLHRRIAERKSQAFKTATHEIAGELAAHFEAAHDPRRALEHRVLAGDLAVRRHADHEAAEHFRHALRLLSGLGDPAARRLELDVLVKLATRLMSTVGYGSRELEEVFDRAYALSRQLAPGTHLAPLLRGLVSFHQVRARSGTARAVGEELLALCEHADDEIALVQAHYGHGVTLYDLVELDAAQRHLEFVIERYDAETHLAHVDTYGGYDPGVACRSWLAWLLWLRGAPEQALRAAQDGVALAERLGHPFTLGFANLAEAMLHLSRGDHTHATIPLARAIAIADEDGFPYMRATVAGLTSWACLLQGKLDAAIAHGEESLAMHEATGAVISRPGFHMIVAYARALTGDFATGLDLITQGLTEAGRTDQRLHLVQLGRARGELLMLADSSRRGEAESCHREACAQAQALGAPMLKLQAAIGLARFLRMDGRGSEVQPLLGPIYESFSEGFDTAVLKDARMLLEAT